MAQLLGLDSMVLMTKLELRLMTKLELRTGLSSLAVIGHGCLASIIPTLH